MSSKQVLIVAVLVAVFAWSTVMTVLGQLAAVAALLPRSVCWSSRLSPRSTARR